MISCSRSSGLSTVPSSVFCLDSPVYSSDFFSSLTSTCCFPSFPRSPCGSSFLFKFNFLLFAFVRVYLWFSFINLNVKLITLFMISLLYFLIRFTFLFSSLLVIFFWFVVSFSFTSLVYRGFRVFTT